MSTDERIRVARDTYQKGALDASDIAADPLAQFGAWLEVALRTDDLLEPHAMMLATVGAQGQPSARVVLLRGYDQRGFVFFTNYASRKGRELEVQPRAALVFFWPVLQRQIRIEGSVERLATGESDVYFAQRPRGHRLSAWASKQSSIIPSRAFLDAQLQLEDERFGGDVPRPPNWGGYRVIPHAYEFWQGRPDRMHDRFAYVRDGTGWTANRLSP